MMKPTEPASEASSSVLRMEEHEEALDFGSFLSVFTLLFSSFLFKRSLLLETLSWSLLALLESNTSLLLLLLVLLLFLLLLL